MTADPELADFARLNPDPMMKTDRKGVPVYLNPAAKALFPELDGGAEGHPLLKDWPEVAGFLQVHEDHVPFVRLVPLGDRVYEEHIFHACDRSQFWMYINDVTEREQVDRLKRDFLQNVCHELNTPLTCLCGCLQSLREDLLGTMSPAQDSFMQVAVRGARHLADMVNDLGDSALAEQGRLRVEPRRTDAALLAKDAVASFNRSSRGDCAVLADIPQNLPPALADPVRVRQVLNNLVSNARKFTPPGGTVRVGLRVCEVDPSFLRAEVSDTGCGIDPADARRLFERLFKANAPGRSRQGLGIGLYLCRELVTRQGGRIWMESRPGQGTTFFFTLPVFSLSRLLAPMLGDSSDGGVALLCVEALPPEARFDARLRREAARAARESVGPALSRADVLLPELAEPDEDGTLFIVTRRGPDGARRLAEALAVSVREALEPFRLNLAPLVGLETLPAVAALEARLREPLRRKTHECPSS